MMKVVNALIKRINNICYQRKLTINKLSTLSAVPPTTLKNILNGNSKNPGISTIKKICDGLDMDVIEFFNSKEFKNLEQEIK